MFSKMYAILLVGAVLSGIWPCIDLILGINTKQSTLPSILFLGKLAAVKNVGQMLLDSFTTEQVNIKDLTEAEELIKGLTFDKYVEKTYCKVLTKIKPEDFYELVTSIAKRYHLPDERKDEILDGKYGEVSKTMVNEFKFNKGLDPGYVVYGRTMTLKRKDGTIDLAYGIYSLDFKLAPRMIQEERKVTRLLFFTSTEIHTGKEERHLSEKDKHQTFDFYRAKALKSFTKEFAALAAEDNEEKQKN